GSVAIRIAPLLLVPLLAHTLRPEHYGIVDLDSMIAAVLAVALGLGLDAAAARLYYDVTDEDSRRGLLCSALILQLLTTVLIVGALAATAPAWADAVTGRKGQTLDVRLALLSVPPTATLSTIFAAMRVRARVRRFTLL